ncbi:hypothetical protein HanIR_Chr11g0505581 [Helianthus annuus]|nr:hypothetical protein HanIR_Chr11g0505581 [Helianthus annuus]
MSTANTQTSITICLILPHNQNSCLIIPENCEKREDLWTTAGSMVAGGVVAGPGSAGGAGCIMAFYSVILCSCGEEEGVVKKMEFRRKRMISGPQLGGK